MIEKTEISMGKGLFKEYMNSRGKIEKPTVSVTADKVDPMNSPVKPPKAKNPYKNKNVGKKSEKGFGDMGDPDLKINFDTKGQGKAPAKLPVCERIELASLVAKGCVEDPSLMEELVVQIKKQKMMGALVVEVLEQKETFEHISEVMAHQKYGPDLCAKLVRAMNEQTAPNFSSQLSGEEEANSEEENDDESDPFDGGDPNNPNEDPSGLNNGEEQSPGDGDPSDSVTGSMADPSMAGGADMAIGGDMGIVSGVDPSIPNQDPNMGAQEPLLGKKQPMPPAMANFQRAMMKRFQQKMMSKR